MLQYVGWSVWVCGLLMESVADRQKDAFKSIKGNEKKLMKQELFAYVRFPNYAVTNIRTRAYNVSYSVLQHDDDDDGVHMCVFVDVVLHRVRYCCGLVCRSHVQVRCLVCHTR